MCSDNTVSIVIPVYNKGTYLQRCIESIVNQSYPYHEIIIVDDGSSDDSYVVAQQLQSIYKKINIIQQENQGVSVARNVGINKATGKWIMFIDPDDRINENCLSSLIQSVSNDVDIICSCCYVLDEEKITVNHFFDGNRKYRTKEEKKDLYIQLMDSQYGQPQKFCTAIGVPWAKLYRRSFLEQYNLLFDPRLKRAQDNIFNMYAFSYAKSIIYIDQPLYEYTYEHMYSYFDKYRENFKDIFCAVYKARMECVNTIHILDDDDVKNYYLSECCKQMIIIFKNAAFHKKSHLRYSEKKKIAKQLRASGCFENVLTLNNVKFCHSFKHEILWALIKHEQYFVFNILALVG